MSELNAYLRISTMQSRSLKIFGPISSNIVVVYATSLHWVYCTLKGTSHSRSYVGKHPI